MPFGEYIPFRQQLGWLTKISRAASSNRIPGTGEHLLVVTGPVGRPLPIGVLICFESAFPDMSRVAADKGGQLIVYQSATSTFQNSWAPAQHASLAALRAAETGRPVVQAALTGVSAAFDARGAATWPGSVPRGTVWWWCGSRCPSGGARTLYDRLGEYVPLTAVAVSVIAAGYGLIALAQDPARRGGAAPVAHDRPAGAVTP